MDSGELIFLVLDLSCAWNQLPESVIASTLVSFFKGRYARFVCQSPEDDNPRTTQETSNPWALPTEISV